MSDLISKKALLSVLQNHIDSGIPYSLTEIINSAPAVSGEAVAEDIFAKFLEKHRHVTGGLRVYSDLNEIEKEAARKGIEFCLINLAPPQPQSVKDALNLHTEQVLQVFNRWMTNLEECK